MDLLKGSAVFALIVSLWGQIKSFFLFLTSFVFERVEIKTEEAHTEVIGHLIKNYKRSKFYDKVYGAQHETYRTGQYGLVGYELFGDKMIIFFSQKKFFFNLFRLPFIYSPTAVSLKPEMVKNETEDIQKTYCFIFSIRNTINIAQIVKDSIDVRNQLSWDIDELEEKINRFNIYFFPERKKNLKDKSFANTGYAWFMQEKYRLLGVVSTDLGRDLKNNQKAIDNLFFPDNVHKLIDYVRHWVNSKDWYVHRNIPWKRGWLLYGPPGTGKTALTRAFAEDLDLPVYVFSLSQLANDEFIESWQMMQMNIPCIALIEDIDTVFDKRKNISLPNTLLHLQGAQNNTGANQSNGGRIPLTFDTLINCIDGVDKSEGIFTIITTNDISKVDPAIGVPNLQNTAMSVSSRPGRIDRVIELSYMSTENKIKMAKKIIGVQDVYFKDALAHIDFEYEETPAQFQEFCSQLAIKSLWDVVDK